MQTLSRASLLALILVGIIGPAGASSYGNRIVASPAVTSSKFMAPVLADLRRYLWEMTAADFALVSMKDGPAISLDYATVADAPDDVIHRLAGKSLDAFVITGDENTLRIAANNEQGLADGVYFYLEQLGVRWLLPGDEWTIVPKRTAVDLTIDRLIEPSYKVRSYSGTGGFFAYWWGRRYPGSALFEAKTKDWQRRLRYGGSYVLAKDVGSAFVADPKIVPILKQHPDYLAKVDGAYTPLTMVNGVGQTQANVVAKLNAGSPEAVALFCGWAQNRLRFARAGADVMHGKVVSVEPSDGFGYGTDIANLPGNGSPSDQTFFIANQCARQVRSEFPDASVILLAYAGHAAPPSFALEPNVIVEVAPYAFQDTDPDAFIAQWGTRAERLAIYDYWCIPDWSHDEPSFDFTAIAGKLRRWRAAKIEALNAETTYGAGAMGLGHYVAAHLMWDLQTDERALIEEWFDTAFGPAKAPMQRMMERWAHGFRLTPEELGASYQDLSEAERLASDRPDVVARVDDFVRYVHYIRLRLEFVQSRDPSQYHKAVTLTEYLLDINASGMVQTSRQIDLLGRQEPGIYLAFDITRFGDQQSTWTRIHLPSRDEVHQLLEDGMRAYPSSKERDTGGSLSP